MKIVQMSNYILWIIIGAFVVVCVIDSPVITFKTVKMGSDYFDTVRTMLDMRGYKRNYAVLLKRSRLHSEIPQFCWIFFIVDCKWPWFFAGTPFHESRIFVSFNVKIWEDLFCKFDLVKLDMSKVLKWLSGIYVWRFLVHCILAYLL